MTYDDVRRRAAQIAAVTARRIMPPWKPEPGKGDFQRRAAPDRRRADEAAAMDRRRRAGRRSLAIRRRRRRCGSTAGSSAHPISSCSMPAAYTVPADGADVFRTFVMPIDLATVRATSARSSSVRATPASCITPTSASIARVRRASSTRAIPSPATSAAWCATRVIPEGQMLGWTPGQAPHPVARRHAVAARAGQRSRRPAAPAADRQDRTRSQVTRRLLLHRRAADARRRSACASAARRSTSPPATREYVDRRPLRAAGRRGAVWRCSRTRTTSRVAWRRAPTLPDGASRWLIAIADWDFRWQDVYRYAAPIALPEGHDDRRCATPTTTRPANPRNPHRPPARVVWGQNTSDEMGDLWMQVMPRADADFARLERDFRRKTHRRRSRRVHEAARGRSRQPAAPRRGRRVCYLEAGRLDEAIDEFRESLRPESGVGPDALQPRVRAVGARPPRRGDRGASRGAADRSRLRAGAQQPRRAAAARRRRRRGARAYRRAAALRPDNVEARDEPRRSCCRAGAVRPKPCGAVRARRSPSTATTCRRCAGLAWIRATAAGSGAARRRRGGPAGRAGRPPAVAEDVTAIDALAAAYAAAGRFDEAVRVARSGLELAAAAGQHAVAAQFRQRLELYQKDNRCGCPCGSRSNFPEFRPIDKRLLEPYSQMDSLTECRRILSGAKADNTYRRTCRLRRIGMTRSRIAMSVRRGVGMPAALPATARAQSAFAGVVKDATGAVLPGVTVEAGQPGADRESALGRPPTRTGSTASRTFAPAPTR